LTHNIMPNLRPGIIMILQPSRSDSEDNEDDDDLEETT